MNQDLNSFCTEIFNDIAFLGIYTVTAPTNIIARYGDTCVRGGEPEEVAFPQGQSQETLEVQAAAPETATLTVSFTGTGTATNYNCSTYVSIKAWGVDIDVDTDNSGIIDTDNNGEDEYEAYAPGLILTRTDSQAEEAGMRYPVRLSSLPEGLTDVTIHLEQSGNGTVRLWESVQAGASPASLPRTWVLANDETPPATVWVDGVTTGAVTLVYSVTRNGSEQTSDRVRLTVIPPAAYAPGGGDFAAVWAPLATNKNANAENNLGVIDGTYFADEIKHQGFTNVVWYKDETGDTDLNLGSCTYENYLNIRNAGAVCVTSSHGDFGTHLAVYAPYTAAGQALIENWCANRPGMVCQLREPISNDPLNPGYYYAEVSGAWLAANWKPSLDARRAIVAWNICRSATGSSTLSSVKEAAGGRWRIGYAAATTGFECGANGQTFFKYMNGSKGDGLRRTAGAAFGDGSEYSSNVRMSGNPWTTLCPAPVVGFAMLPNSGFPSPGVDDPSPGKGWGCILFDTYMSESVPASQVISGAAISNARWVTLGAGKRAVGFNYDKRISSSIWLNVQTDGFKNEGVGGGRKADQDGVRPNGEASPLIWVF